MRSHGGHVVVNKRYAINLRCVLTLHEFFRRTRTQSIISNPALRHHAQVLAMSCGRFHGAKHYFPNGLTSASSIGFKISTPLSWRARQLTFPGQSIRRFEQPSNFVMAAINPDSKFCGAMPSAMLDLLGGARSYFRLSRFDKSFNMHNNFLLFC